MKTIKKITIALFIGLLFIAEIKAQEYKVSVGPSGKIMVNNLYGEILIEGHSGSELIITATGLKSAPERAKGLKSLYGTRNDNTGIGLSVMEENNVFEISGASKQAEDARYKFLVPNNVFISLDCSSPFANEDIVIRDYSGEVEAKILNGGIEFENLTGPAVLYATNGDVVGTFLTVNQEYPISITSINGDVDVSLPNDTKADLKLSSVNGEIFTDMDIEFNEKDMPRIGGRKVKGKLNGGGVDIHLETINKNIYLRKK